MPWWIRVIEHLVLRGYDDEYVQGDLREEYTRRKAARGGWYAAARYLGDLGAVVRARTASVRQSVGADLRHTLRLIARRPAFSLVSVLTLSVGMGATIAIYSVADAVLLTGLPYRDAGRLMFVSSSFPGSTGGGDQLSYLDIREIERRSTTLEGIAAYHTGRALQLRGTGDPERIRANIVDPGYLELLGASASRGRLLGAEDGRAPGAHPVVVVSHGFWTNRLAADPEVIGRTLELSGVRLTIVGVLAPGFRDLSAEEGYSFDSDVFIPVMMIGAFGGANLLSERGGRNFWAITRPRAGVALEQAAQEVAAIGEQLQAETASTNRGFTFWAVRLDRHLARDVRGPILLLIAGSTFVLLIACANVANLMLSHVSARIRELSIRRAVGASRQQVLRLLAIEATLIAAAGGVLGMAAASITGSLVRSLVPGELTPRLDVVSVSPRVFAVALGLTACVALVLALLAGLRIAGGSLLNPMRDSSRATDARGAATRRILLVVEIATAVILLVGAHLMVSSLARLRAADPGFRVERLITFEMDLRATRYAEPAAVVRFGQQLHAVLGEAPGIEAALLWGPGRPGRNTWVTFPGREDTPVGAERVMTWRHTVTPGALRQLEIPLLRGREFDAGDRHDSLPVVIVSQTVAQSLWPGEDAIGKRLRWRTDVANSPVLTVVGVAADVKHRGRINHLLYPPRDVYVPHAQRGDRTIVAVVRAAGDMAAAVQAVRSAVRQLDPDLPLFNIQSMAQHLAEEEAETRFAALLMTTYAALALGLAAMGIYGVLSYHVTLRSRELAVRMALGARRSDVLRLIVLDGLRPTGVGIVLGVTGAFVLGRALRSLLFGVRPDDPLVFGAVVAVLVGVALIATLVPAAAAVRTEPAAALRQ